MKEIDKEFRFYERNNQNLEKDPNNLVVIKSEPLLTIDEFGNITTRNNPTYCLAEQLLSAFYTISKSYFGIKHIDKDYYIVIGTQITETENKNEDILHSKNFNLKFGIIELGRHYYTNSIEAEKEKIIAPIEYDRIYIYDNLYPIMEKNGHYTYFCLDSKSQNYKKQLIPLILESASPFNIKYEGFAECIIEGKTRFIPIDLIATEFITLDDLLTEEEVLYLINSYEKFEKIEKLTENKIPTLIRKLHK